MNENIDEINSLHDYYIDKLQEQDYKSCQREEKLQQENKQLKEQLQQRDEAIEECIESIQNFMTHIDDGFCADMMTFIDILNKYKGDKNGN